MSSNVTIKAKKNIKFGLLNKTVLLLCPFIERTVVNYVLGSQYLGLNSLFSSILTVLSLSELGFSSAIVYFMYKPISEGNVSRVNALLNYYRKVYRVIGIIVLTIGFLVIPILHRLITGSVPDGINIKVLYLIYLINSVISYYTYAYMSSIIVVHQRDDINSVCNTVVKLFLTLAQTVVLLTTKNYYLFIVLIPAFTVINNVWIAIIVHRQFPQYKCEGKVPEEDLCNMKRVIAGSFIQKICNVTRNSLDSICISSFLGLTMTAIYNNYYYILNAITLMLSIVTSSFIGGVGNHVATKTKTENFSELRKLDFAYLGFSGWCTVCLLCLYQPFMEIWMGKSMTIPFSAVVLFCVYFYVLKLGDMRYMYMSANGLFWQHRWRAIAETVSNIVLNIIFGKYFGIHGIILATIISLLICNFIWANLITFSTAFTLDMLKDYYSYQVKYFLITFIICLITYKLCSTFCVTNLMLVILVRSVICILIPGCLYWLFYHNSIEYKSLINKIFS